jgi:hypothetical protein
MKKKFDVDKWFNPSKELTKACELMRYFRMDLNLDKETTKKCAMKVVDEILSCPRMNDDEQVKYEDGTYARSYYEIPNKFWTKVKHEIEQL